MTIEARLAALEKRIRFQRNIIALFMLTVLVFDHAGNRKTLKAAAK